MKENEMQTEEVKTETQKMRRPAVIAGAALVLLLAVLFLLGIPQKLFGNKMRENLGVVKEGSERVIEKDEERKEVLMIYADDVTGFFNPAYTQGDGDKAVSQIIFEPLMEQAADGSWQPVLAKNLEISEDGLTYTLTLERNVLFSDGTPMTAQDAAVSLAALGLTGNGGIMTGALNRVEGMEEFVGNPVQLPAGLEVPDENTLVIHFTESSPDNLLLLGAQVQKVDVAESAEEEIFEVLQADANASLGTGAYMLTDSSSGSSASLVVNPNFRKQIDGIRRVEFRAVSYYDLPGAIEDGELDLAVYSGTSQLFDMLYDWDGFSVYAEPGDIVYTLFFNQDNVILRNEKVRQAIACGFNRNAVIKEKLVKQLMYKGGIGVDVTEDSGYNYDTVRARDFLKKAGEEVAILNTRVVLNLPVLKDNGVQNILARALKEDLSDLGIEINIQTLDQQEYMRALYLEMNFDLYLAGVPVTDNVGSYENFFQSRIGIPIDVTDSRLTEAYAALTDSTQMEEVQRNRQNLEKAIEEARPSLVMGRSKSFISLSADIKNASTSSLEALMLHIYEIQVK